MSKKDLIRALGYSSEEEYIRQELLGGISEEEYEYYLECNDNWD